MPPRPARPGRARPARRWRTCSPPESSPVGLPGPAARRAGPPVQFGGLVPAQVPGRDVVAASKVFGASKVVAASEVFGAAGAGVFGLVRIGPAPPPWRTLPAAAAPRTG